MIKRKITIIFLSFILLCSLTIVYYNEPVKAVPSSSTFRVWVVTDHHYSGMKNVSTNIWGIHPYIWPDAINDSQTYFDWDIALCLGDVVNIATTENYSAWTGIIANNSEHKREDFYTIAGNHEGQTPSGADYLERFKTYIDPKGENNATSFVDNSERNYSIENATGEDGHLRYEFKAHNIVFILMGPDIDSGDSGMNTYPWLSWWTDRLEANEDRIVFTCSHHQVDGVGLTISGSALQESATFVSYLQANQDACDVWLQCHGHVMGTGETRIVYAVDSPGGTNCTFMNCADLLGNNQNDGWNNNWKGRSYLFTFTDGSDEVEVSEFHHFYDVWEHPSYTNPGNVTIQLSMPFEMDAVEASSEFQITDISGKSNDSIILEDSKTAAEGMVATALAILTTAMIGAMMKLKWYHKLWFWIKKHLHLE